MRERKSSYYPLSGGFHFFDNYYMNKKDKSQGKTQYIENRILIFFEITAVFGYLYKSVFLADVNT